jgi:polyisoprenyl-teichoic acid--peptidoglycan teichoic acid transferase
MHNSVVNNIIWKLANFTIPKFVRGNTGTLLATCQVMDNSTDENKQELWRSRRIVTRYAYDSPRRSRGGGVLYARRKTADQQTSIYAVFAGIILIGGICLFLSAAMIHRTIRASQQNEQPVAAVPAVVVPSPEAKPGKKTSLVLLGSDQRPDDGSFRTDVILYITIDPNQQEVSVISFPRDLWVNAPDFYEMKINTVHQLNGFETTAAMFEENFGIHPDYYILTNFDNFQAIINSLDGVDVEVGQDLTDDCDLPQAVDGDCTVTPGTVHMDGATALWYVRSRKTTSDYDRMRRMQEVLYGVFNRMMSINAITRIPELYETYSSSVETNMGLQDILPLVPVAVQIFSDTSKIQRYAINEETATPSWSWDGQWILLPDPAAIENLIQEAGAK